jgi:hypothetical protein
MFRNIIIGFIFSSFICNYVKSQTMTPEIYLNHIFIVLDSDSYIKLSDSNFITQKLGNIKTSSTSTTEDSWSGKYLFGKNGYFEFFSTKGYKGALLGDCGLGFMTKKANDILELEKNWKKNSYDSIIKDTSVSESQGIKSPWFYSLNLFVPDSLQPFSVWVMENTPDELKSIGFSTEEVKNEIKWEDYAARKSGKVFNKSFNQIKRIHLLLNTKNYQYLKRSLLGFGLQEKENMFFNNQVAITYFLDESFPIRLKTIETELNEVFAENKITLSKNISVYVNSNKAIWTFGY